MHSPVSAVCFAACIFFSVAFSRNLLFSLSNAFTRFLPFPVEIPHFFIV